MLNRSMNKVISKPIEFHLSYSANIYKYLLGSRFYARNWASGRKYIVSSFELAIV